MNQEAIKGQNKLKLAVEKLEFELFRNDRSRCAVITIEGCGNYKLNNITVSKKIATPLEVFMSMQ